MDDWFAWLDDQRVLADIERVSAGTKFVTLVVGTKFDAVRPLFDANRERRGAGACVCV